MKYHKLRLILGDQLDAHHSWFKQKDDEILYVLMEVRPECEYVTHHIQKIVGIFSAMRQFAHQLEKAGHQVKYFHITDEDNLHSFESNIKALIRKHAVSSFEYQAPDEYRLDQLLEKMTDKLELSSRMVDSEHFLTKRMDLKLFFEGKKQYLMENFYRMMRKKYNLLMEGDMPVSGRWNLDKENRKKSPKTHVPKPPFVLSNDVSGVYKEVRAAQLDFIGELKPEKFLWPISREQALQLFHYFMEELLPYFGMFQDAMSEKYWSLYHSRISFALNIKLIHPLEIVRAAEEHWRRNRESISLAQIEGFIRQVIGWREYMWGVYWANMPSYQSLNYFDHKRVMPAFYWDGQTRMNCMARAISQSFSYAYAHHIQRLMITGNFALLAGIDPSAVDEWYLGIYIDAFEWVEITNTRGMSQFADGGIVGTKPYISSAAYINKMGDYCQNCHYDYKQKIGERACPFNSLYWSFLDKHREKLSNNQRMSMMYRIWDKMNAENKAAIVKQAQFYLKQIEDL